MILYQYKKLSYGKKFFKHFFIFTFFNTMEIFILALFLTIIKKFSSAFSFIFLYILCTMSVRQNMQKALGLAPSRAVSKLSGGGPGGFFSQGSGGFGK